PSPHGSPSNPAPHKIPAPPQYSSPPRQGDRASTHLPQRHPPFVPDAHPSQPHTAVPSPSTPPHPHPSSPPSAPPEEPTLRPPPCRLQHRTSIRGRPNHPAHRSTRRHTADIHSVIRRKTLHPNPIP